MFEVGQPPLRLRTLGCPDPPWPVSLGKSQMCPCPAPWTATGKRPRCQTLLRREVLGVAARPWSATLASCQYRLARQVLAQ